MVLFFIFFLLFPLFEAHGGYWAVLNSGVEADLLDLHFVGPNVGYVVGGSKLVGKPGVILKTSDGGRLWEIQPIPTEIFLNAIDCVDETHCLVVGDYGVILKTTDGVQWTKLTTKFRADLWSVSMIDANTAIAVGNINTILKTTDGGATWHFINTENKLFKVAYSNVFFIKGTSVGWIAGAEGTILKTINAGKTWIRQDTLVALSFWDIFSLDGQVVWVAGGMGDIYKSTDAGTYWVPPSDFQPLPPVGYQGIYFTDPFRGFAVGPGGIILKSRNSGESWDVDKSPVPTTLNEVQCLNPALCFIVGEKGVILRYMNTPAGNSKPKPQTQKEQ